MPANLEIALLLLTAILAFITPLYLKRFHSVFRRRQLVFSTLSFVVWVYSLGGPFRYQEIIPYDPQIGAAVLIVWTLGIPFGMTKSEQIVIGADVLITERGADFIGDDYAVLWDAERNPYCGKEARVTSLSKSRKIAKLNIDKGQFDWAVEWLQVI